MNKSPDAFRTISEVAEILETPAHVLRFWESRFPQIRPVKRAGGRRYYRPADVALLIGIKRLLHDEGMTIRGVQKILREQGVRHVSGVTDEGDEDGEDDALVAALAKATGTAEPETSLPLAEAQTAQIIALQAALRDPLPPPPEVPPDGSDLAPPEAGRDAGWQKDPAPEDDVADTLPDDAPRPVAEPAPPPVGPARSAPAVPVVADLFARVPPPAPAPAPPVAEAPMAVWAEDAAPDPTQPDSTSSAPQDKAEPDQPPPVLRITRIGTGVPPVPPPVPPAASEPVASGPTLAQRLRAVSAGDLAAADRQRLSEIRDRALALRARLAGPAHPQV
ncbi:MAG: MerR family transcriptional regulator [Paracoccaceae bacterium]